MCLYGDKGKSDDVQLENKSDNFEKGDRDDFKIDVVDVGKPFKMRVWHDNNGMGPGWHLKQVRFRLDAFSFYPFQFEFTADHVELVSINSLLLANDVY